MPLAVENLTKKSNIAAISKAINKSVGQCMDEPIPEGMTKGERQKQCVAISYSIAREKTGRELKKKS